jgi:hypothetical protein
MLWCASAVPARRAGRTSASPRRPSNIRKAPFARGYFLGDYMGMDDTGTDFATMFGRAFVQNNASQYFGRLTP